MTDMRFAPSAPNIQNRRTRPSPTRVNAWLVAATVTLCAGQLYLLPLWLLRVHTAWGWTLAMLALTTTPFWSLIHEAIHGTLFQDRRANDRWGRILAVLHGAPFTLLKTGHLLHHRYNRTPRERSEIHDPQRTNWARAAPGYYLRLFGGLYLLELASVMLALLPASVLAQLAHQVDSPDTLGGLLLTRITNPQVIHQFRLDAAAVVALHTVAFLLYWAHFWMLALAMLGRAVVISLADNTYHYATKLDAPLEAMNLRLPRPLERFTLNFTLHHVHHRHPGLPRYDLPGAFQAEKSPYHLDWLTAVSRQVHGPIKLER